MPVIETEVQRALEKLKMVSRRIKRVAEKDRKRVRGLIKLLRQWIKKPPSSKRKSIIIIAINELVTYFPTDPGSDNPRLHLYTLMEILTK